MTVSLKSLHCNSRAEHGRQRLCPLGGQASVSAPGVSAQSTVAAEGPLCRLCCSKELLHGPSEGLRMSVGSSSSQKLGNTEAECETGILGVEP